MTSQKKGQNNNNDLTEIGKLPEFSHEENTEINNRFSQFNHSSSELTNEAVSIDSLDELPPELPSNQNDENSVLNTEDPVFNSEVSDLTEESSIDESTENSEDYFMESPSEILTETEAEISGEYDQNIEAFSEEMADEVIDEDESNDQSLKEENYFSESELTEEFLEEKDEISPIHHKIENLYQEKFEDVKNFALNFSYGTIKEAGNPPFSIIVRNIKFTEDAQSILSLLKEFAIVNSENLKDYENSLSSGALIIPQISEFTAIILAHKLRRFDLDIEVGLSDEVHPSKSGEMNPRGLTKKDFLKQNHEEEFKIQSAPKSIKELIVTTANTISGHQIDKYLGILNAHAFIDEEDINRLSFIDKSMEDKTLDEEDQIIYKRYKDNFEKIHDELLDQLKVKAFKEGANALIGVQFTTNSFADHKKNKYQITCTCTKATISKNSKV